MPKPCTEKPRLLREYEDLVRLYDCAVKQLLLRTSIVGLDRYNELKKAANDAHNACEKARRSLDRHTAEHGC